LLLYLLSGLTGIISGMGVGGGILLIPILVFLFHRDQHLAQGITLLAYLPTSLVAAVTHYLNHNCRLRTAAELAVGGVFGSFAGAALAAATPSRWLQKIFAVFLTVMAVYQLLPGGDRQDKQGSDSRRSD